MVWNLGENAMQDGNILTIQDRCVKEMIKQMKAFDKFEQNLAKHPFIKRQYPTMRHSETRLWQYWNFILRIQLQLAIILVY